MISAPYERCYRTRACTTRNFRLVLILAYLSYICNKIHRNNEPTLPESSESTISVQLESDMKVNGELYFHTREKLELSCSDEVLKFFFARACGARDAVHLRFNCEHNVNLAFVSSHSRSTR